MQFLVSCLLDKNHENYRTKLELEMNQLSSEAITCPYCGEIIELLIDCSVSEQAYIEDCEVCCRPINLFVSIDENGQAIVISKHENE